MPTIFEPQVEMIRRMDPVTFNDDKSVATIPAITRSRPAILIFVLSLIGVGLFYWWIRPDVFLHRGDTLYYVGGAQSFTQGTGYRISLYEDAPGIGLYPPLQSLFLSLFWPSATLPNFDILNVAMIGLLIGCMGMLFASMARSNVPWWWAIVVTVCMAVQPNIYFVLFGFLSDLLFSLLSFFLAALWLRQSTLPTKLRWGLTGATLGLMFLARTAAAPVLLGLLCVLLVRAIHKRDWKPLLVAGLPMIGVFLIWHLVPKETVGYSDYYREKLSNVTLGSRLMSYLCTTGLQAVDYNSTSWVNCLSSGLPRFLAAAAPQSKAWFQAAFAFTGLIAFGCLVLCGIGYWRSKSGTVRVIGALLALYMLELIFWPFKLGARGLLPTVPFICFGFWAGLTTLPKLWQPRIAGFVGLLLVIGIAPSAYLTFATKDVQSQPERYADLQDLAAWTRGNIAASAHLVTEADWYTSDFPMLHFVTLSGHKLAQNHGRQWHSVTGKVDYVLMEAFPPLKQSIDLPEKGILGEITHRTPHNYFQVLKLGKHPSLSEFSAATKGK